MKPDSRKTTLPMCATFSTGRVPGMGIPELRAVIQQQIHTLPHGYDEFPASYFAVKEALEAKVRRADFIDLTDYGQLCQDQGMVERRAQDILLRFLHELGNVLNFHDPASPHKLQETKVFNPERVTAGVYALLNSPPPMSAGGSYNERRWVTFCPIPIDIHLHGTGLSSR